MSNLITFAEAKTRFEEMHFHKDQYLYEVQRAIKLGSEACVAEAILRLDEAREGDNNSVGGTYEKDYFGKLADYIYHFENRGCLSKLGA